MAGWKGGKTVIAIGIAYPPTRPRGRTRHFGADGAYCRKKAPRELLFDKGGAIFRSSDRQSAESLTAQKSRHRNCVQMGFDPVFPRRHRAAAPSAAFFRWALKRQAVSALCVAGVLSICARRMFEVMAALGPWLGCWTQATCERAGGRFCATIRGCCWRGLASSFCCCVRPVSASSGRICRAIGRAHHMCATYVLSQVASLHAGTKRSTLTSHMISQARDFPKGNADRSRATHGPI